MEEKDFKSMTDEQLNNLLIKVDEREKLSKSEKELLMAEIENRQNGKEAEKANTLDKILNKLEDIDTKLDKIMKRV